MKSSGKSRAGEVLTCIYNGLSLLCWARFSNQGQLPDAGSENPGGWVHPSQVSPGRWKGWAARTWEVFVR